MKFGFGKSRAMKIRTFGDPALSVKAKKVEAVDNEILQLAEAMIESMRASDGLGLAAPQVGISLRMATLEVPAPKDLSVPLSPGERELLPKMPLVLINPEIVSSSPVIESREEGCLSVPEIYAEVSRPVSVTVRAQILGGPVFTLDCGGLLGRAMQHELDHLDGIVFVQRLSDQEYAKIKPKLEKLLKSTGRKTVVKRIAGS